MTGTAGRAVLAGEGGTRVEWAAVPEGVRASVAARAGSEVVSATSQRGGFSPALAARLVLADGRRAFVKAIGPDAAPGGTDFYRAEAAVAGALPDGYPAPRLLDHWEQEGWIVLLAEDAGGRPPRLPWEPDDLRLVLEGLTRLAELGTPPPVAARPVADALDGGRGWRRLAAAPDGLAGLERLDPWVPRHLDDLARWEARWADAASGDTLLHCDLRRDNILVTDRGAVFVDWPHASVGARWVDLCWLLPSVAMQGGPPPHEVFAGHPLSAGVADDDLVAVLAAFGGFMFHGATQPPPPGLPHLRAFQRAQGDPALAWLRRLAG